MLNFTTLRTMLLGFAGEPIELNYTDPRYVPIRINKVEDGFRFQIHGWPIDYTAWISPYRYHSNTGYMGLHIQKTGDHIDCLTLRVCATSAGMVYEYKFNFTTGKPAVEMRQGRGRTVTGERVHFEKVRCIDLVIFDLINLMLPPQITAHRPEPGPYYGSTADKACFVCDNVMVPYNWEICGDCRGNVMVAAM